MKRKLLLIPVVSVFLLVGCNNQSGTESDDATSDNETTTEDTDSATEENDMPSKNCMISTFSFALGEKNRVMTFKTEDGKVRSVTTTTNGEEEANALEYAYDEDGKLTGYTMGDSKATYVYDDGGMLIEITGEGNLMTRKFEYDENGNIQKQVTYFGEKPYMTYEYTYDEMGAPVKATAINQKGEATEENIITYDDKNNPFVGLGGFINSSEMFFGYPIGNYKNNVASVTKKYLKKTSYKIDGDFKNPGDEDVNEITMEYNEHGYPVSSQRGDKGGVTITYMCE